LLCLSGKKEYNYREDKMTQWQCEKCGYTFGADKPLDRCPSCNEACTFRDITCYTPDCGGPGNIDPQLASRKKQ
jgi:rubredoxin